MKTYEKGQNQEDFLHEKEGLLSRREYLISLKKWSKAVIGGVLLGSIIEGCAGTAWSNSGSGWGNQASPWRNNIGGWRNNSGGWRNGSAGWRNGSGGGWKNSGGGGWKNHSGGGWKNSGGGGNWVNRRI